MCTNRWSVFAIVIAVWLSGCSSRVYGPSRVQDTVAILPDGGKILLSQDVWNNPGLMGMFAAKPERTLEGPLCIWQRPDQPEKKLVTLLPAPGSPVEREPIYESVVRVGSDGNQVLLIVDSQVIGSFDYQAGVAILSRYGQPEWAQPSFGEVIRQP